MSIARAGLSPVSAEKIILAPISFNSPVYQRFCQLLSEEVLLKHEKSINGRVKRSLDTLLAEAHILPDEMGIIHTVVSNTVHVILSNGERVDYNEFLDNGKGAYPAHIIITPDNDDALRMLSELMGVTGLYSGYAKWIQEIIQKVDK